MVTVTEQTESRPDPRRWWALGALVASMLVLGFDTTILNVALPTIAEDLGATTGEQQWMADAYIVVFAALMLPAGLLGDRFGRRRMLIGGLGVFLAASLVGALASDVTWVITARALMGVGGAFVMPLALSVLPSLFPREEQTKALGAISAASALGLPLGPIIGGWLLDHFWWGSVFVLNVPMVAIGITACLFLLPESRDPAAPGVDAVSTALTVIGLGSLIYGIIEGPGKGWGSVTVIGSFVAAVVLIGALVLRERGSAAPMLDLSLLSHRGFLSNTLAATLGMFVLSGVLFLLPQYLRAVLGTDALGTGVRLLPLMAGMLLAARLAQPLVVRFGARSVVCAALAVLSFAAFLGARTTVGSGYGFTALWLSIAGVGIAFAMIPAMGGAMAALDKDQAGRGSGLLSTVRQTGSALGVALLGALLAGAYTHRLSTAGLPGPAADAARDSVVGAHVVAGKLGDPALAAAADSAFVHGMDLALVVIGIVALAAALLSAALLPSRAAKSGTGDRASGTEVAPVSADA
ncbi:DHA2 family efflux MFS transporter permease subunit [Streptomyces sp. VRA16 Mangrove soil]|uniref:DHA2 family efflux MFS transporter permease subunit n=1 Tax=Streptomyces sp. VRA16 Mangrove soil TaxID=2817434 RepID=UPI001A9EB675|nr:DHA2 family efflux MFS transporter permease subunit [Streptomyces sp. VRA16 Mangrove soil]MBO1334701.1 DHA2 family efflux MFS transporter permease subunit [Streptomyces sp. VRA16 Mangrove soil]